MDLMSGSSPTLRDGAGVGHKRGNDTRADTSGGVGWGQGGFTGPVLITHNHVGVYVHPKKARGELSNTFILKFPG